MLSSSATEVVSPPLDGEKPIVGESGQGTQWLPCYVKLEQGTVFEMTGQQNVKYDEQSKPQACGTAKASRRAGVRKDEGAYVKHQLLEKERKVENECPASGKNQPRKVRKERMEVGRHQSRATTTEKVKKHCRSVEKMNHMYLGQCSRSLIA